MSGSGPVVALDGFGVEGGFDVLAEGARRAAADGIAIRIFGPPDPLGALLDGASGVELVETSDWIANEDDPVPAVRSRPEASVVRAVRDVAEGRAGAVTSLGSTGATRAAATFGLKRIKGVKRPALAAQVPLPGRTVLFLDVGANVEVRALHLVQFACLGASFMSAVKGVESPEVGLLSVGEEKGKGRPEEIEAHERLEGLAGSGDADELLPFRFIGNVEGNDIPDASADVVVTDGFTGNAVLKAMEGAVRRVTGAIRDAARSSPLAAAGGILLKPALGSLRDDLHPDTTGGALMLGLRHVAVVGHGGSGPDGVANAVRLAAASVEADAPGRTAELLHQFGLDRREDRSSGETAPSTDGT
ncbi:MAG: phosphate acyltransferase [Solirubrobacterales bacterium]